jgi:ribosomal protein L35
MELHLLQGLLDKKTLHFRQLRETKMVPEFYVKRVFRAS